jgi:hypothetical protein
LREADLSALASVHPVQFGHLIHGFTTKIDEITAERTKGIEKFAIL